MKLLPSTIVNTPTTSIKSHIATEFKDFATDCIEFITVRDE